MGSAQSTSFRGPSDSLRRLLRKWGAAAQDHCFAAVPSCGCQTRKDDECDAEASGRSHDAATTATAAVPGRNPPVPFGLLRHGAICFVGSSRRSARLCLRTPAYHMAPWRE